MAKKNFSIILIFFFEQKKIAREHIKSVSMHMLLSSAETFAEFIFFILCAKKNERISISDLDELFY